MKCGCVDMDQVIGLHEPSGPAERPTTAPRGSWERIEEYARRAESGVELFHPDDSQAGTFRRGASEHFLNRRGATKRAQGL